MSEGYRGSHNLKKSNVAIEWTQELLQEFVSCSSDPIYFAENYMKIVSVDKGLITIPLYDYQKDIISTAKDNRFTVAECSRQSGKTTAITVLVLWYIIFHPNKTVAILANKADTAREILSRIQLAYEHLPKWLQQGVVEWNKGSFVLENGSRVLAAATSSNNIRGYAVNCVDGKSVITVKDKETGFINILTIDELKKEIEMRKNAYGFVYLTENLVNGKKYIGAHRSDKQDSYLGSGKFLIKAINKYGKDNFKQTILEFAYCEETLFDLEKKYISEHDAVNDKNYYNISDGGKTPVLIGEKNGFFGKKHSSETREKMKKGRAKNPKKYTEEEKRELSLIMKERWNDPEFKEKMKNRKPRRKFTEEDKRKHSEKMKGKKISDETRKKLSESTKKRFESEDERKKLSEAMKTRDNSKYQTEEFRENARQRLIAYNKSEAKKELNRKTQTGKKLSKERKENISKGLKKHYAVKLSQE